MSLDCSYKKRVHPYTETISPTPRFVQNSGVVNVNHSAKIKWKIKIKMFFILYIFFIYTFLYYILYWFQRNPSSSSHSDSPAASSPPLQSESSNMLELTLTVEQVSMDVRHDDQPSDGVWLSMDRMWLIIQLSGSRRKLASPWLPSKKCSMCGRTPVSTHRHPGTSQPSSKKKEERAHYTI